MKRLLLSTVAFLVLGVSFARADIRVPPPPPPPKPPTKPRPEPDPATLVAGTAATASLVLAGVWVLRSRRRIALQS
jgi:hypothetical protein